MVQNGTHRSRKRANGEGTIRQRPTGLWEGQVLLPNGKRRSVYGKTQKEVREKLRTLRDAIEYGRVVGGDRQRMAEFLDEWLEGWIKPKVRQKTYDTYRMIVQTYLIPSLGRHQLGKLTSDHVQRLLNDLATRPRRKGGRELTPLSPRTVQACRDVLRIALGSAVKRRLIAHNVAKDVEPPKVQRPDVQRMTREQADALLEVFCGTRMQALVTTALTLGLRRGELLGLRWQDVDFKAGVLAVRRQVQWQDGQWQFLPPKSKDGKRKLPIPAFLADVLRTHRHQQLEERLAVGAEWQEFDLVFPTEVGTPQHGMNITHRFQDRLKKAGLPRMRFHDLRHGAATILFANGFTLKEIQEILGHSTFRMTADTYGHLSDDVRKDWGDRMQRAFG